ncbi:MAG: hypothetical protein NZO58_14555, partial [Gemmataceae bacterium]|nr:hypothetical protein [Gemmataceae bacterium]
LQRLAILDPQTARELSLPADDSKPVKFEVRADPTKAPAPLPSFTPSATLPSSSDAATKDSATSLISPTSIPPAVASSSVTPPEKPPVVIATTTGTKMPTFRGKAEQNNDDPFDWSNQRQVPLGNGKQLASQLLARANQEFGRRRYKEARLYYEQAFEVDQKSTETVRDSWAYCLLSDVVSALKHPTLDGKTLNELQRDTCNALAMAQAQPLVVEGQKVLREIERRMTAMTGSGAATTARVAIQHFGKNTQGWQVAETANFRIFHNQPIDLVTRVAEIAEATRLAMNRKWFGHDGEAWSTKCELVLHPTAAEYSRQTGVPPTSPGHSRIESDPTTHRILGRRIDLHVDNPGMLEAVLPHETTHCVLAGQFGPHQVPRWADEGMAVLSEPLAKIEQHRQNLSRAAAEGQLFAIPELLALDNYPPPRRISAFYAQSVALVSFLVQQRGPTTFSSFVRDGLRIGWDAACRQHYGWDLTQLQQRWEGHLRLDNERVAAGR